MQEAAPSHHEMPLLVCLDSSAWIEIAHNGPNAESFSEAAGDMSGVIVSSISLYEVFKYTLTNAGEFKAIQITDLLLQGMVIPPDAEIAISASKLAVAHKLAMADALIYATAQSQGAELWTQDCDFEGLPGIKYFKKQKPTD